jgi:hypothetical protein
MEPTEQPADPPLPVTTSTRGRWRSLTARLRHREGWTSRVSKQKSLLRKVLVAGMAVVFSAWAVPHFAPGIWSAVTGKKPVTAYVSFEGETSDEPAFVIPRPIDQIPVPPVEGPKRYAWAKSLGGVESKISVIRVIVQGSSEASTLLTGLRIEVVEQRPGLAGTYIAYRNEGGGIDPRDVFVTLDGGSTTVTGGESWSFPLTTAQDDVEVFYIYANTEACDCSWRAFIDYEAAGEKGTLTIDDDGAPFRTTSFDNAAQYISNNGRTMEPMF